MRLGCGDVAVLCAILVLDCSTETVTAPGGTNPGPGTEAIAKKVPLYSGSIGLVVDTRDIFKRGYAPRTADISFDGQAAFNTVLTIDSLTDVAILVIQKDSLSAAQKDAFAAGIATTIVIRDANHTELGRVQDVLDVDDSNQPLSIATSLPALTPPLVLGSGAAYLLQREGVGNLVTRSTFIGGNMYQPTYFYDEEAYPTGLQQFTFTQRADSTYLVGHVGAPDSTWCGFLASEPAGGSVVYQLLLRLARPSSSACAFEAHIVLEQDPDGWMRLKETQFGAYVAWGQGGLTLWQDYTSGTPPNSRDQASRFRLISDDIDWTISDQGTWYDQPIMPPAHLNFAYVGSLTNCSSATLKETVGDDITQSTTTTFTTLESFQLFTGNVQTVGVKASASVDIPITGTTLFGETVKVTAEASWQGEWSTNKTRKTETTQSTATTSTVAVSRSRELQLLPFTGVIVADYVKAIGNVVQPFTQKTRLRGVHRSNGAPLSGREIVTQMSFNFAGGVITRIGADYVEFTIRGESKVDQFLRGETAVQEKVNACS